MLIKQKLLPNRYWLVHPLAIALYLFLILLYFIPNYFQKYQAKIINTVELSDFQQVCYHDLDGDGITEKIFLSNSVENNIPNVYYLDVNGAVINQWNLKGQWLAKPALYFGDYNDNGYIEVYSFTQENDSLFLNVNELLLDKGFKFEDKYFSRAGIYNDNKSDIFQVDADFFDVNNDGKDEFVFTLYGGYSKYPRNTFLYDIVLDTFVESPLSASGFINNVQYMDLNNDGVPEITGGVYAAENIHYEIPLTDSNAWLVVLDPNNGFDYLFPPIECGIGIGSSVVPYFYSINNKTFIAAFVVSQLELRNSNSYYLMLFDCNGNLLKEKLLDMVEYGSLQFLPQFDENDESLYLLNREGQVFVSDTALNLRPYFTHDHPILLKSQVECRLDIDGDGELERLFVGNDIKDKKLVINRSELIDPLIINLRNYNSILEWHFSILNDGTKDSPLLAFQADNLLYTIKYHKSQYYLLKYPIYLLVYLFLFFFFWFLQKVQVKLAMRKHETEKQLMQQQLALSKKQMEPHFMLNTVNNIGYLFLKEDKKKAMFYLGKFAALMRRGLMNADKISTSLEDELEFVEDYLILQKQLMDGELEYEIKLEENIEEDKIQIPHSLIYTFAENAIKHGLRPKEKDRKLQIQVSKEQERVKIVIQDNGVGRLRSEELHTTDTGKGIEIIKTIIKGFNQLHGGNISYVVEDVLEDGIVVGTLVEVWV